MLLQYAITYALGVLKDTQNKNVAARQVTNFKCPQ